MIARDRDLLQGLRSCCSTYPGQTDLVTLNQISFFRFDDVERGWMDGRCCALAPVIDVDVDGHCIASRYGTKSPCNTDPKRRPDSSSSSSGNCRYSAHHEKQSKHLSGDCVSQPAVSMEKQNHHASSGLRQCPSGRLGFNLDGDRIVIIPITRRWRSYLICSSSAPVHCIRLLEVPLLPNLSALHLKKDHDIH